MRATCRLLPLQGKVVKARMLVCADGSTSRLATQLGYCTAPPQVRCQAAARPLCSAPAQAGRFCCAPPCPATVQLLAAAAAMRASCAHAKPPCPSSPASHQGGSSRALVIEGGPRNRPDPPSPASPHSVSSLPTQGVSSRAYIEGGSHNANFDGLVFYPKWSLPG